jgi:sec-independent protein translocase protein TatB
MPISPAKLLIILVIAVIVLGPEKLPSFARQMGALWGEFRKWRQRIESEVRGNFPDLPDTSVITHAVRNPITILNKLADEHESRTVAGTYEPPSTVSDTGVVQPVVTEPAEEPPKFQDRLEEKQPPERIAAVRSNGEHDAGAGVTYEFAGLQWPSLDDPSFN